MNLATLSDKAAIIGKNCYLFYSKRMRLTYCFNMLQLTLQCKFIKLKLGVKSDCAKYST